MFFSKFSFYRLTGEGKEGKARRDEAFILPLIFFRNTYYTWDDQRTDAAGMDSADDMIRYDKNSIVSAYLSLGYHGPFHDGGLLDRSYFRTNEWSNLADGRGSDYRLIYHRLPDRRVVTGL